MKQRLRHRGSILAGVLLLIALSAMVAASLMHRVRAESGASVALDRRETAQSAVRSGVQHVLAILRNPPGDFQVLRDNPDLFQNRFAFRDGSTDWYFSVYSPAGEGAQEVRYGLTDEAGRININTAEEELLAQLPQMGQEQVDCLLDYRDSDDETRSLGAEQDAYGFMIRNRPLIWTLEELLVVQSFTPQIVYGEDVNFNGLLEANEDDADATFPPDDGNGLLARGLKALCTVWSYEYDVDNQGRPRRDVNGDPRSLASVSLPERTIEFLRVWKEQKKPPFTHPSQLLGLSIEYERQQRNRRGQVSGRQRVRLDSGIDAGNLDMVLDQLTVGRASRRKRIRGKVNVNTAPVEVLSALLARVELPAELAENIVEARLLIEPEELATPAWLYRQGIVADAEDFKKLAPYLTARGLQYRFYVIGFTPDPGIYALQEIVVDLAPATPRIVYQRDLSRLGPPIPLDLQDEEIRY